MTTVLRAFLSSLILHALLLVGMAIFAATQFKPQNETAEIEIIQAPPGAQDKKPSQSIVRKSFVPEKMKAPEDETLARFLSEQKQRVKVESQAANSGMTENRSNTAASNPDRERERPQQRERTRNEETDKDGYRSVDISKELQEMNRMNQGFSTVGESLPTDVKVGSFTALNTDRYLYYTFYARIEELVRFRWESMVSDAIHGFDRNTLMTAGNRNWVTQVEFLLDRTGLLKSAVIMKESGIQRFDLAAVNAFKDARIFPNPPQEMIKEDGMIHLRFTFNVNYRPGAVVNR